MNRRIMFTLAIVAGLLNSGFSVGATDSDIKPVSVQSLKEKVEEARIEVEKATARANEAESKFNTKEKIIGYSKNLVIAALACGGVIAPLVRTLPAMGDFIRNGIVTKVIADSIEAGLSIQVTAAGLMMGTIVLAGSIINYFGSPYWKINGEKYTAEYNYEKAKEELAKELAKEELARAKEELARAEKQNSSNCHIVVIAI